MASTISAGTTTTTALVQTADTSGVLQLQTNGTTTAVTIDTAQNVGIGVTPSAWISTFKSIDVSTYASFYGRTSAVTAGIASNAYQNSGGTWTYKSSNYAAKYDVDTGQHIWWNAASGTAGNAITFTQAMTLDTSQFLHVGETSHTDGSMFYSASFTALNSYRATTVTSGGLYGAYSDVGGTKTIRAYFRADGGLANYSANNVNLSDKNLKKDIAPAGNYLAKICAIPVKNFRYKDQSESEDITLGIIAQDVLAVAPELVSQEGFGTSEEDKQNYLSIYQTDLQYALMKCIQELSAQVTTLQTQVTALQSKG